MKTTIGTSRAVRTKPRSEAEPVRSRTAKASATGTSMSPKTEIACAEKRSRNSRSRSASKESGSRARTSVRLERAREVSVRGEGGPQSFELLRRAHRAGLAVAVARPARQEVHVQMRDRVPVDLVVHL